MPDAPNSQPVAYYDRLASEYDTDRFGNSYGRFVDHQERDILRAWLRGVDPAHVVDLGCGTGRLLDFAGTGIDASAEMLKVAAAKHPGRRLVHAALEDLDPAAHGTYQAATCFHVFMHLDPATIERALVSIATLVRPGGHLLVDIPSRHRRAWKRRRPSDTGWHGNTDATASDLVRWAGGRWRLAGRRGLLALPVHRFPAFLRPALRSLDAALGRSWLGRWASYHVYRLERLP